MITIFYGDIGKGKTLSAVLLAEFLRDMKIKQKRKYKVFDNCEYKHSTNTFYDYFSKDNLNDLETDKILIFDEIDKFSDSRNSSAKLNRFLGNLISLSRKTNTDFIGTLQMWSTVDKRVKNFCSLAIQPKLDKEKQLIHWEIYNSEINRIYNKTFKIDNLNRLYNIYNTKALNPDKIEEYKEFLKTISKNF